MESQNEKELLPSLYDFLADVLGKVSLPADAEQRRRALLFSLQQSQRIEGENCGTRVNSASTHVQIDSRSRSKTGNNEPPPLPPRPRSRTTEPTIGMLLEQPNITKRNVRKELIPKPLKLTETDDVYKVRWRAEAHNSFEQQTTRQDSVQAASSNAIPTHFRSVVNPFAALRKAKVGPSGYDDRHSEGQTLDREQKLSTAELDKYAKTDPIPSTSAVGSDVRSESDLPVAISSRCRSPSTGTEYETMPTANANMSACAGTSSNDKQQTATHTRTASGPVALALSNAWVAQKPGGSSPIRKLSEQPAAVYGSPYNYNYGHSIQTCEYVTVSGADKRVEKRCIALPTSAKHVRRERKLAAKQFAKHRKSLSDLECLAVLQTGVPFPLSPHWSSNSALQSSALKSKHTTPGSSSVDGAPAKLLSADLSLDADAEANTSLQLEHTAPTVAKPGDPVFETTALWYNKATAFWKPTWSKRRVALFALPTSTLVVSKRHQRHINRRASICEGDSDYATSQYSYSFSVATPSSSGSASAGASGGTSQSDVVIPLRNCKLSYAERDLKRSFVLRVTVERCDPMDVSRSTESSSTSRLNQNLFLLSFASARDCALLLSSVLRCGASRVQLSDGAQSLLLQLGMVPTAAPAASGDGACASRDAEHDRLYTKCKNRAKQLASAFLGSLSQRRQGQGAVRPSLFDSTLFTPTSPSTSIDASTNISVDGVDFGVAKSLCDSPIPSISASASASGSPSRNESRKSVDSSHLKLSRLAGPADIRCAEPDVRATCDAADSNFIPNDCQSQLDSSSLSSKARLKSQRSSHDEPCQAATSKLDLSVQVEFDELQRTDSTLCDTTDDANSGAEKSGLLLVVSSDQQCIMHCAIRHSMFEMTPVLLSDTMHSSSCSLDTLAGVSNSCTIDSVPSITTPTSGANSCTKFSLFGCRVELDIGGAYRFRIVHGLQRDVSIKAVLQAANEADWSGWFLALDRVTRRLCPPALPPPSLPDPGTTSSTLDNCLQPDEEPIYDEPKVRTIRRSNAVCDPTMRQHIGLATLPRRGPRSRATSSTDSHSDSSAAGVRTLAGPRRRSASCDDLHSQPARTDYDWLPRAPLKPVKAIEHASSVANAKRECATQTELHKSARPRTQAASPGRSRSATNTSDSVAYSSARTSTMSNRDDDESDYLDPIRTDALIANRQLDSHALPALPLRMSSRTRTQETESEYEELDNFGDAPPSGQHGTSGNVRRTSSAGGRPLLPRVTRPVTNIAASCSTLRRASDDSTLTSTLTEGHGTNTLNKIGSCKFDSRPRSVSEKRLPISTGTGTGTGDDESQSTYNAKDLIQYFNQLATHGDTSKQVQQRGCTRSDQSPTREYINTDWQRKPSRTSATSELLHAEIMQSIQCLENVLDSTGLHDLLDCSLSTRVMRAHTDSATLQAVPASRRDSAGQPCPPAMPHTAAGAFVTRSDSSATASSQYTTTSSSAYGDTAASTSDWCTTASTDEHDSAIKCAAAPRISHAQRMRHAEALQFATHSDSECVGVHDSSATPSQTPSAVQHPLRADRHEAVCRVPDVCTCEYEDVLDRAALERSVWLLRKEIARLKRCSAVVCTRTYETYGALQPGPAARHLSNKLAEKEAELRVLEPLLNRL